MQIEMERSGANHEPSHYRSQSGAFPVVQEPISSHPIVQELINQLLPKSSGANSFSVVWRNTMMLAQISNLMPI